MRNERPVRTVKPVKLIAWIFGGIGLLFVVLGVIFLLVSRAHWPLLTQAASWTGDAPDELALPIIGVVFTGIGLPFVLAAAVMALVQRRNTRRAEELRQYGERLPGVVTEITVERSVRVNGRSPLRIVAEAVHPRTKETLRVRSACVWETPLSPGDAVTVLVDPMDERRRMVELPGVE